MNELKKAIEAVLDRLNSVDIESVLDEITRTGTLPEIAHLQEVYINIKDEL